MKVALILCPSWDTAFPIPSLALFAALLKNRGHEAEILDLNHQMARLESASETVLRGPAGPVTHHWTGSRQIDPRTIPSYGGWLESIAERLSAGGARLVGFSAYLSNLEASYAVARMLKRRRPDMKIVFGGPSCLTLKEGLEHLKQECVDAVVLGEADLSFPRLVDGLARSGRLEAGPGVLLREDPSTWKDAPGDVIAELDALPFTDFGPYAPLDAYSGIVVNTSRGCVRKCVYCSDWREMPYRRMTGRRIFEEFVHHLERHPHQRSFMFGDSLLNGAMKELGVFCDLAIAEKLPISWGGNAIVRSEMTPAFLEKMSAAGCGWLGYGIESGSWRVLQTMHKYVRPELNARVLRDTRRAGIVPTALWMVGFPTETEEAFLESRDFIAANAESIGALAINLFSIGEMRALNAEYGLAPDAVDPYWRTRDGKNTFPVRLDRLRRLMEAAQDGGIKTCYNFTPQGPIYLHQLKDYERRALRSFRAGS
ncbi:MAG: B12-binding domain-containing radical SAM protein [Elusimicrobiota bacterium]